MRTVFLILLGVVVSGVCFAANEPSVTAKFVPDSIAIGDQFRLRVEVSKDIMQIIDFPQFEDKKLGGGIEILHEFDADTLKKEGRQVVIAKEYLLTTFDAGVFVLGKFPLMYGDKNVADTLWSRDSMVLKVATFEIDTTTMKIFDIVPPLKAPLKFDEIKLYLYFAFLALLFVVLIVLLIIIRRSGGVIFSRTKVVEPAHVVAIRELENLNFQKLWQNNRHKQYYSRLTDILRKYIESRYGIAAMEMTTNQTMEEVNKLMLSQKSTTDLDFLLHISDLVKFAKHVPDTQENERAFLDAYYFVEETKLIEQEVDEQKIGEELGL